MQIQFGGISRWRFKYFKTFADWEIAKFFNYVDTDLLRILITSIIVIRGNSSNFDRDFAT